MVGMDVATAYPRYTFNITALYGGIAIIPAIVGLYSLTQLLTSSGEKTGVLTDDNIKKLHVPKITPKDFVRYPLTYIKSSIIGAFVGIVPGAGGNIAGYMAYNEAKRASKTPDDFGKGCREGVAATESANKKSKLNRRLTSPRGRLKLIKWRKACAYWIINCKRIIGKQI